MTCVIGWVGGDRMLLAADVLVGFAGSYRMGQLLMGLQLEPWLEP